MSAAAQATAAIPAASFAELPLNASPTLFGPARLRHSVLHRPPAQMGAIPAVVERRIAVFALAIAVGAGAGIGAAVYLARRLGFSGRAEPAGRDVGAKERRAPDFRLVDEVGRPVSLSALRGRTTIVTFIDPVCRNLCPLEAQVLTRVEHDLGLRAPALLAVSVNPQADTRANFRKDADAWELPPAWRWAIGTPGALARVWRDYEVGVRVTRRGVVHTEAAYVIDANGYERALFIYPFVAVDVEQTLKTLGA